MKTFDDFEAYKSSYDTPEDKHAPAVGETIRCKINGQRVKAKVRRIKLVSPRLLRDAVKAGEKIDPLLVMAAHPIRGLAVWLAEVSPVQPGRPTTPDGKAREDENMAKKKHQYPKLRRLGQKRAECAEHVCNGDEHIKVALETPQNVPLDKNACARAWEVERDRYEKLIAEEAAKEGMTVEYNGVYPSFIKDGRTIYFDQL